MMDSTKAIHVKLLLIGKQEIARNYDFETWNELKSILLQFFLPAKPAIALQSTEKCSTMVNKSCFANHSW